MKRPLSLFVGIFLSALSVHAQTPTSNGSATQSVNEEAPRKHVRYVEPICPAPPAPCPVADPNDNGAPSLNYSLRVTYKFVGSGRVVSAPAGIDCGPSSGTCIHVFPRATRVTLTATPAQNWSFGGWNGDMLATGQQVCTGVAATTSVSNPTDSTPRITCVATFVPMPQATFPSIDAFRVMQFLLFVRQFVDLGVPVSQDEQVGSLSHFQVFRQGNTVNSVFQSSNSFFNSIEMHQDGCIYAAYTTDQAPNWYDIQNAEDSIGRSTAVRTPPLGWPFFDDRDLATFEELNHGPGPWVPPNYPIQVVPWMPSFVRYDWDRDPGGGHSSGPFFSGTGPAAHWFKLCPSPSVNPFNWPLETINQIPNTTNPSVMQSGSKCGYNTAGPSSIAGVSPPEWVQLGPPSRVAPPFTSGWPTTFVEGYITNSYLSGQDATIDHAAAPDGYVFGPVVPNHRGNCSGIGSGLVDRFRAEQQLCNDWEINVKPDPQYLQLLAPSDPWVAQAKTLCAQGQQNYCGICPDDQCGKGSFGTDMGGDLGVEIEQWLIPVLFRPEPGDRTLIAGRSIVDCGHDDWHTELHPMELMLSSHMMLSPFNSTNGSSSTLTKAVITGAWQGGTLEFNVWPSARPFGAAHLHWTSEKLFTERLSIESETLAPSDNPNHLVVRVAAANADRQVNPTFGDVVYDPGIRFAATYHLWWQADINPPVPHPQN